MWEDSSYRSPLCFLGLSLWFIAGKEKQSILSYLSCFGPVTAVSLPMYMAVGSLFPFPWLIKLTVFRVTKSQAALKHIFSTPVRFNLISIINLHHGGTRMHTSGVGHFLSKLWWSPVASKLTRF